MSKDRFSSDEVQSDVSTLNNEIAVLNELGAKNLLPNKGTTQTVNGVTFIVNSDGSVTVNGTSTALTRFALAIGDIGLESDKQYIFSGLPEDSSSKYLQYVYGDGRTPSVINITSINGGIITPSNHSEQRFDIIISANQTLSNYTFKPMVRPASITDDTYVPYAMTNRELSNYCLTDYSNFEDISSYATEEYSVFNAPYTGWYYMRVRTSSQNATPFVRLALVHGYVFEMSGVTGAYKSVSSPPIFITAGTEMVAQGAPGCVNSLLVKKVNL